MENCPEICTRNSKIAMKIGSPLSKSILGWDVCNWGKALTFWEDYLPPTLKGYKVLELGARQGGLSLYFALQGAQVICTDLQNPEPQASNLHQKYGVNTRVSYQSCDASVMPFPAESFDLVCFKSVLGGIRKQACEDLKEKMISEIFRVLKPGGFLVFAENLRGCLGHQCLRNHFIPWSAGWEYLSVQEIQSLLQDFDSFIYSTWGFSGLLGRNERQRQILGRLDHYLQRWLPSQWNYIIFGVAQK